MCCMAFLFSYESKEICCQYTGFSLTGNHKTKGVTETELLPPWNGCPVGHPCILLIRYSIIMKKEKIIGEKKNIFCKKIPEKNKKRRVAPP